MRRKTAAYTSAVKSADPTTGRFEAVVAVFGNVDLQGDRLIAGAFAKSLNRLRQIGDPVPVIFSHQWTDLGAYLGSANPADIVELPPGDPRLPSRLAGNGGLLVRGTLDVTEPEGRKAAKLLRSRIVKEFSFAYDVMEERPAGDANELLEVDLIEVGPTLKGANPLTALVDAKHLTPNSLEEALAALPEPGKTALPRHTTATDDGAWDGPAAESRLPSSQEALEDAHAWRDPDGDPDTKAAYAFIHHDVSADGAVGAANLRACSTGIGILNGGRGGGPDARWWADRAGIWEHLAGHLRDADQEPPPLTDTESGSGQGRKTWIIPAGTLENVLDIVRRALRAAADTRFDLERGWFSVEGTYVDSALVSYEAADGTLSYYTVPYTVAGDTVTVGDFTPTDLALTVTVGKSRGKEGRRNAAGDLARLQTIHDLTVELGVACPANVGPAPAAAADQAGKRVPTPAVLAATIAAELLDL